MEMGIKKGTGGKEGVLMVSLNEDSLEEILDRIPLKPLIKMKCLSTAWLEKITVYRQSRSRATSSAFFYQYHNGESDHDMHVLFLIPKEQSKQQILCLEHESQSFSITKDIRCFGSSNGLFLWKNRATEILYVSNPTLNQWVALPPLQGSQAYDVYVGGLAFDGLINRHFKVVSSCFHTTTIRTTGYMEHNVFSSDTGEWSKRRGRVLNFSFLQNAAMRTDRREPFLYRKNMIHWLWDDYMMVYHIANNVSKLVKLPHNNKEYSKGLNPRLWESDECLHYCYSEHEELIIYACLHSNLEDGGITFLDDGDDRWQLKHTIELKTLRAQEPEYFAPIVYFEPCGFDEDLQIVYIQFLGVVICYSLETQRWTEVFNCTKSKDKNDDSSSLVSFCPCQSFSVELFGVSLPIMKGECQVLHPKSGSPGSGGRSLLLL